MTIKLTFNFYISFWSGILSTGWLFWLDSIFDYRQQQKKFKYFMNCIGKITFLLGNFLMKKKICINIYVAYEYLYEI